VSQVKEIVGRIWKFILIGVPDRKKIEGWLQS